MRESSGATMWYRPVPQPKRRFWRYCALFIVAQGVDAYSTYLVLLRHGHEINPTQAVAYFSFGLPGLLAMKVLFAVLVVCAARIAYLARSTRATRLAPAILCLGAGVGLMAATWNAAQPLLLRGW